MEREPTIKERIELFIQRLLDNGFVEQDEDEVQQYIMFFIGTPLDTRIFRKDIITICISESSQEAEIYMNGQQFLGKRNFTDFIYGYMFNIDRGVPYGGTTHEINHFSDFLKNQSPDAVGSSNMYKWMRSAIKPYSDSVSKYFSSPTEQKAYMNQLREFMYANKMIDTRDQVVTPSLIKTALDKLPKGMDSVKKASDQFKSLKSYTKWFNTVPLLGVGAIGANKYFTNNESRN